MRHPASRARLASSRSSSASPSASAKARSARVRPCPYAFALTTAHTNRPRAASRARARLWRNAPRSIGGKDGTGHGGRRSARRKTQAHSIAMPMAGPSKGLRAITTRTVNAPSLKSADRGCCHTGDTSTCPHRASLRTRHAHEPRLLHHHGRAVLLVAGRQRAADFRDRAAARDRRTGVDDADAEAVLRRVLRRAGGLRRRLRRLVPQGQGHVHHEPDQDRRLPPDAVRRPPAARLRGRRFRRGGLLARQVRDPDRAAAAGETGRRQRLDRGTDGDVHHRRLPARRHPDQPAHRGVAAGLRSADVRHRNRPARRIGHRGDHERVRDRHAVQPRHSGHRRPLREAARPSVEAAGRLLPLLQRAVARQARAGLARRDHALLGRGRHAAVHRAEVGRAGARARPVARGDPAGRGRASGSPSEPSTPLPPSR